LDPESLAVVFLAEDKETGKRVLIDLLKLEEEEV
jgi:hypothetical protein